MSGVGRAPGRGRAASWGYPRSSGWTAPMCPPNTGPTSPTSSSATSPSRWSSGGRSPWPSASRWPSTLRPSAPRARCRPHRSGSRRALLRGGPGPGRDGPRQRAVVRVLGGAVRRRGLDLPRRHPAVGARQPRCGVVVSPEPLPGGGAVGRAGVHVVPAIGRRPARAPRRLPRATRGRRDGPTRAPAPEAEPAADPEPVVGPEPELVPDPPTSGGPPAPEVPETPATAAAINGEAAAGAKGNGPSDEDLLFPQPPGWAALRRIAGRARRRSGR